MRRVPRSARVFSYSAEHEPAVRVSPGETLLVETKNAFGDQTFSPGETLEELSLEGADPLTGPIFVDGAEPGDTLAVEIDDIKTVGPGMQGVIPDFGILEWRSDVPLHFFEPRNGTIEWLRGIEIELRPNLGAIPSIWPGDHGGNMDAKYVCAGSTVYFPVFHSGALLVMGDCHQIQGDGELCGVAPETEDASRLAVEELVYWMADDYGFEEHEAVLLLGQVAEARCTQLVNPKYTYVAKIAKRYLEGRRLVHADR